MLSQTVKSEKPLAKVIYNDYDNFKQRLNAISTTNKLLEKFRKLVKEVPNKSSIPENIKTKIINVIADEQQDCLDYITLSTNLLFSMNYASNLEVLQKQKFYNRIRKSNYDATGYLDGVDFVKYDYKVLFNQFKDKVNVVFLVDPPYLSTDCSTYKNYWKLADYLDVLKVLINTNYFYFTSNKSSVVELCQWMENNTTVANPFNKAKVVYRYNTTTHNTGYTDIMLHKRYTTTIS